MVNLMLTGRAVSNTFDGVVTLDGEGEIPELLKGTRKLEELPEPRGFVFLHDD